MTDRNHIAAVLLAAGGSSRYGATNKLFALLNGEPLILHSARIMARLTLSSKFAVCRPEDEKNISATLAPLGFEILVNPDHKLGLSSSLGCGVAEASRRGAVALLVSLADMPFVSIAHLERLFYRFDAANSEIVASRANGIALPPALFASSQFQRLQSIAGDCGAKTLLTGAQLVGAPTEELADIDTPEELRRLCGAQ